MDNIYSYIIPFDKEMYEPVVNQLQLIKFNKENNIEKQLRKLFPNYDVEKTMFAFKTPKLDTSKCSYDLKAKSIEEFLPIDFVTNYSSFIDLPLYKIDKSTSTIKCLNHMSEQDKLLEIFMYKQQLENQVAPILYLLQHKSLEHHDVEKIKSMERRKSKRDNCCFENLICISGYIWGIFKSR